MALTISSITVSQVNGAAPASAVNLTLDSASQVTACPEGATDQNGVTFSITIKGTQAEVNAQASIYFRSYTSLKWHIGLDATELVGGVITSAVTFTAAAGSTTQATTATGTLTLYFPEKLAGTKVALLFGLTEASVANTAANRPKPGITQAKVKYLDITSSVENAPLVQSVYWSEQETIEFGQISGTRSDICRNEDAFLHIHTRGLFGKRVTVELYGRADSAAVADEPQNSVINTVANAVGTVVNILGAGLAATAGSAASSVTGTNTADNAENSNNDSILLKRRDYLIKDNVLCIAFTMSEAARIFYPGQQETGQQCILEARVRIAGTEDTEANRTVSGELTMSGEEAEEPASAETGTSKYVIGNPENRPQEVQQTSDAIPARVNIHVGTLTFLSGDGTEETETIGAAISGTNYTENNSTYFTYQMDTYELRLQDFINAGLVEKDEVLSTETITNEEGLQITNVFLNTTNIYETNYTVNNNTTTIYGFKSAFRQTVQNRLSTNNLGRNVDYAQARKLKEAIGNNRTAVDSRRMCRSAWQLRKGSNTAVRFNKYKGSPFRYSSYQECPPGAFYLVPPISANSNRSYLTFVGDTPTGNGMTHWTQTTRTGNNTTREEIKKPNSTKTDHESSARSGIALHRGKCINAVGCITLDEEYDNTGKTEERNFYNHVFSGDNGEWKEMTTYNSTAAASRKTTAAILKLHLIMIEERAAVLRNDIDTTDPHPKNRYRGQ